MSDATALAGLIAAVAADLATHRDELNRLDGVAGDGDLGLTVATAAAALLALAPELAGLSEADAIRRCGSEIARTAPSTGGTLIAFGFLAAARVQVEPAANGASRAVSYLEAAAATIGQRGKSAAGDRTMLDALLPAVEALRDAAAAGSGIAPAVAARRAAEAAGAGALATASMEATLGRAGWLADRARGHEDAGARLVALAFEAGGRHLARPEAP